KLLGAAVDGLGEQIAAKAVPWQRELGLLKTVPGFGDAVAQAWIAEIGPAPHDWFSRHEKLASWVTLCPGNNISAKKRKYGRTGDAGPYLKPMLIQAAWPAIRVRGRLPARYHRLVRRFGGDKNPAAKKKAITAIAHTLLKIAYQVLNSGQPCQDLGADFYTRRESPAQRQAYLERQLQSFTPAAPSPSPSARRRPPEHPAPAASPDAPQPGAAAGTAPRPSRTNKPHPSPLPPLRPRFAAARPPGPSFRVRRFAQALSYAVRCFAAVACALGGR